MTGPVPPPAPATPAGTAGTNAGTAGTVAAAPPEPAGEASLEKLPEKLKELVRTVVVSGTVVEQSGDGSVKVRTQAGDVSLKTPTPLPQDRQVTLQIPPGNPPLKALVFMVGPPQTPQAPPVPSPPLPPMATTPAQVPAAAPRMPPPSPAAAAAPAPVAVTVGTVIPATVVSTSPSPPPPLPPPTPSTAPPPVASPATPPTPGAPVTPAAPMPAATVPAPAPPAAQGQPQPPSNPAPPDAAPAPANRPEAPAPQQPAQPAQQQAKPPPAPAPAAPPPSAPATQPAPPAAVPAPVAAPAAPVTTPVAPQPAAQQMPVLKPGTAVEVRVVALPPQQGLASVPVQAPAQAQVPQASQIPSASQPVPPSAPALPTLAATVAGTTSAGQPIVTTERGVMVLNTRTPLAQGTQVAIGLPPVRPAPAEPFDPLRGQDWPALRETLEVLAKADPAGTRSLANAVLPQANARLAGTLLAFTGAVKKGDVRAWLGEEAAKSLEKLGRTDLLEKLEDDFKQLARQAADIPPGDWKPYSVPFSDGTELHRILMHVRQPGAEEVDEDGGGADGHGARANRFLIDLTLSRIGELQLDGLIRPRRFDLILRTHMPLPPAMRHEIGRLFNESVEALGMTGAVSFQAGTQGWVAIQPGPSGRVGMSA